MSPNPPGQVVLLSLYVDSSWYDLNIVPYLEN